MKINNLSTMIRNDIAAMEEYQAVASLWDLSKQFNQPLNQVIKLDAGENQWGYSPKVNKVLTQALFNFYPDSEYKELREVIARYAGAKSEQIIVGSGSDELLDLIFRLLLNQGDKIINCPPTFGMYPVLAKLNRGQVISVNRNTDFSLDIQAIKKAIDPQVKAIVVCSPNNPTGTISSEKEIISLLNTGKIVIADEAYFEFSNLTVVPLVSRYPNLIVFRTLSKWAGLAGLRLGYGIMNQFLVKQLMKIKPPYNVNLAASLAAMAALKDQAWQEKTISAILKEKQRIEQSLTTMSVFEVYPSAANLIFIKVNKNFEKLKNLFQQKQIVVRYYDSYSAIRLSIGKPKQNNKVLAVLNQFNSQQWDSVIFDMDGVLVDVSTSYRLAIKKTVEYLLLNKFKIKQKVASDQIEALKAIPGFNNDWDLSFALFKLLSKNISVSNFYQKAKVVSSLQKKSTEYQEVKDIFQCFYLGEKLFGDFYQRSAPLKIINGLISNEKLLIDLEILTSLAKQYRLGIATSRPRAEALFALRNLKISSQIIQEKYIVAQEDAPREKPFPDPLMEAKKQLNSSQSIYVGDSVNDLIAAQKAKMPCVFVGTNTQADFEVSNINQIKGILL